VTPEQLALVQESYASLGDGRTAMTREFYRRLFAADPTIEALLSTDPDVQTEKFASELAAIVEAIGSFDEFAPRLADLAVRHVDYGVVTRHYRLVGQALLGALEDALGPAWDTELEAAWRLAYNLVAEVMMSAAAEVSRSAG
jgi:hemoglobin-like flavoprotein